MKWMREREERRAEQRRERERKMGGDRRLCWEDCFYKNLYLIMFVYAKRTAATSTGRVASHNKCGVRCACAGLFYFLLLI